MQGASSHGTCVYFLRVAIQFMMMLMGRGAVRHRFQQEEAITFGRYIIEVVAVGWVEVGLGNPLRGSGMKQRRGRHIHRHEAFVRSDVIEQPSVPLQRAATPPAFEICQGPVSRPLGNGCTYTSARELSLEM